MILALAMRADVLSFLNVLHSNVLEQHHKHVINEFVDGGVDGWCCGIAINTHFDSACTTCSRSGIVFNA